MYRFGNYEVDCEEYDMDNIADIFASMYLSVVGTAEKELKEALEQEGYSVKEVED